MSSKDKKPAGKAKKKKGKQKEDPNKLSNVDQTFYELTINDLNNKLSRLRSRLISSEEANHNLLLKVQAFEEIRDDITCHMERVLAQNNEIIAEHEETILKLKTKCEREKNISDVRIRDMGTNYNSMKDQLYSEIKFLKGQLSSLHEFRRLREILYERYDALRLQDRIRDQEHADEIYQLEQKAVVERDRLKQEVESKLLQVAQDFTRSREIRNAAYTQRLIRENVALHQETEKLVESQIKMQKDLKEHIARHKMITEEHSILKQLQKNLIQSCQNKIVIIEKLTCNYERLKAKYVEVLRYRELYEKIMTQDKCVANNARDMNNKVRYLGQYIESIKLEKSHLMSLHKQQEDKICHLKRIVHELKCAVNLAMEDTTIAAHNMPENFIRTNLLAQCINIINSHSDAISQTASLETLIRSQSSIYHPGQMGLVPTQPLSLMEIFRRSPHAESSYANSEDLYYEFKSDTKRFIPKQRIEETASIIDVEWGSSLYVSTSQEDLELLQIEDNLEDMGAEEESSSSYGSSHKDEKNHKSSLNFIPTPVAHPNTEVSSSANVVESFVASTASTYNQHLSQSMGDEEEYSIEFFY